MHPDILTDKQKELLPLVKKFKKNFGLVGGTAIALQIGHRESIDFDMFSMDPFENTKITRKIRDMGYFPRVLRDEMGQYTLLISDVQMTFFHYPYPLEFSLEYENILKMPDLCTLGAMKLFALGRRAKWKDYVDLFFLLRNKHSLQEISDRGKEIFGDEYNERIIREQLSYFQDINYSEEMVFRPGFEVGQEEIKQSLVRWATD